MNTLRNTLKNTTIIIQCYKNTNDSIDKILDLSDNIIIYDDGSINDFSKYKDNSKITIIASNEFSGKYETCLSACLPLVKTKYVLKMNGGDNLLYVEEPKDDYDIFLARYTNTRFFHNLRKDFYKNSSSSFISGSIIPTTIFIDLIDKYSKLDIKQKNKFPRFGIFCGNTILNSEYKYYLPDQSTYDFTYSMWGGKMEAFSIK